MYPPIEPYEQGKLPLGNIHTLYYELSGNKDGVPGKYTNTTSK